MPIILSPNRKFLIPGVTIHDKRLDDMQAVRSALVAIDVDLGAALSKVDSIRANFPGDLVAAVGTIRNYPNRNITIKNIFAWLSANASTNIVINIRKNSIVIQNITITSGQSNVVLVPIVPLSVLSTDFLTVDIVSGTGKDLCVRLDY